MLKSVKPRRIITVGGTLLCALGIGYFMQSAAGGQAPAQVPGTVAAAGVAAGGAVASAADAAVVADALPEFEVAADPAEEAMETTGGDLEFDTITLTAAVPELPEAQPVPAALPSEPVTLAALDDAPVTDMPVEEKAPAFSCEVGMTAVSGPAAMVSLSIEAPCMVNERFTLHHNGMMFTGVTADNGVWKMDVPALSPNAVFITSFANGEGAVAEAEVDTLEYYDRYVVQWKGYTGLQIHALEYGADYGEPGHVWAEAARDMASAAKGEGGFIVQLGAGDMPEALMAEVYTFPTGTALRGGDIEISLEAEVTDANCGRDIEAQALVKTGVGTFGARDIVMAMPECSATGDFLVLKNLYEDLKIARN